MRYLYLVMTLALLAAAAAGLSAIPTPCMASSLPSETKLVRLPPFEGQEVHVARVADVRFTGDRRLEADAPYLTTRWRSLDALGQVREVVVLTQRWPEDTDVSWKRRHVRLAGIVLDRYPDPTLKRPRFALR